MADDVISLDTCEDIRKIYDDIFLEEIKKYDKDNMPDGQIFRKESVSVYSATEKEIHHGLMPESNIIDVMSKSLAFLHNDDVEELLRIAVFHYLFGYIHPFYDGNGRTSRFISSYLLSKQLNHIIGYRISYTIKENIKEYYKAFKVCNDPLNKGDLTSFVEMFLNIIDISAKQLSNALASRVQSLNNLENSIKLLPHGNEVKYAGLYDLLIQASLFADSGISTTELCEMLDVVPATLRTRINSIPKGLIKSVKDGNTNYYSLNVSEIEKYVNQI